MFKPSELNKAYYDLSEYTKDPNKPFVILYGGRNSSKTYSAQQWLYKKMWNEGVEAVWYRATSSILGNKAIEPFKKMAKSYNLDSYLTFIYNNQKKLIEFPKGNKLYFDFTEGGKSKGSAGIRYVIFDEVDQVRLEDFMTTIQSYRGDPNIRFILMFNPVSDRHWLKKVFFDDPNDRKEGEVQESESFYDMATRLKYTIDDNKFATPLDYKLLEATKFVDENEYRIIRYGEWGTIKVDNPFYVQFKRDIHVGREIPVFDDYPIYLSFDFGKFHHCVLGQHFEDYEIGSDVRLGRLFSESTAANTRVREYAERELQIIVYKIVMEFGTDREYIITGDSAGGSDGYGSFALLRNYMESSGCYNLTFPKRIKLTQKNNVAITNWCMLVYGKNYLVDERCVSLVIDFVTVRSDEYGNIDKNDANKNNISHKADASRYLDILTDGKNFIRNNSYYVEKEFGRDLYLMQD